MPGFNVLMPEVDIDNFNNVRKNCKKSKPQPPPAGPGTAKNVKKEKTKPLQTNGVTKKKNQGKDQLHQLAFGPTSKTKQVPAQKPAAASVPNKPNVKKGKSKASSETADWKDRDEKYVNSVNSKNLEEGILLSTLDIQRKEKQEKNKSEEKENNKPKEVNVSEKKKKKKPTTISLDEFQKGTTQELKKKSATPVSEIAPKKKNKKVKEKFFENIKDSTNATILKEKQQEHFREYSKIEDRKSLVAKFSAEVEERDFENQALRLEVDALKADLANVKQRNKKLCEVIGCSEMKSKGELVVQLEKSSKTRDEYSEEVSKLSAELEQEKTKVSTLNTELKKLQGRRKIDN